MGLEQRKFEPEHSDAPDYQETLQQPEKRTGNVIEFPKRPDSETSEQHKIDTDRERAVALESLRGKILQFPEPQNKEALEPKDPQDNDTAEQRFSEGFEKYKECEACHGTGRRWLVGTCPICKGMGRVVESSWQQHGKYNNELD